MIKLESQHDPFIVFVVQLISFLVNLVQKKRGGVNVSSRRRPLMIDDGATSEYPAPAVKIARPSANTDFNTSYVDLVCSSAVACKIERERLSIMIVYDLQPNSPNEVNIQDLVNSVSDNSASSSVLIEELTDAAPVNVQLLPAQVKNYYLQQFLP